MSLETTIKNLMAAVPTIDTISETLRDDPNQKERLIFAAIAPA